MRCLSARPQRAGTKTKNRPKVRAQTASDKSYPGSCFQRPACGSLAAAIIFTQFHSRASKSNFLFLSPGSDFYFLFFLAPTNMTMGFMD